MSFRAFWASKLTPLWTRFFEQNFRISIKRLHVGHLIQIPPSRVLMSDDVRTDHVKFESPSILTIFCPAIGGLGLLGPPCLRQWTYGKQPGWHLYRRCSFSGLRTYSYSCESWHTRSDDRKFASVTRNISCRKISGDSWREYTYLFQVCRRISS